MSKSINQSEFSHYSLTSRPEFVGERTGGISCRVRNILEKIVTPEGSPREFFYRSKVRKYVIALT